MLQFKLVVLLFAVFICFFFCSVFTVFRECALYFHFFRPNSEIKVRFRPAFRPISEIKVRINALMFSVK